MKQKKMYFIQTTVLGPQKEFRLVNFETKKVSEHYFTNESAVMDYAIWWDLIIVPRPEFYEDIIVDMDSYQG